jgi:voltage-gated potassium channel
MSQKKSTLQLLRQKTHIIVYGTNTVAGRLFDLILLGLILLSVLLVMLETVKGFDAKHHDQLIALEWIITVFFTLEYVTRIAVTNKPLKYIFSFYGIIDLIAILPMYLSFFFVGTKIFSIIRSLRLLRLFKIVNNPKFSSQSIHLVKALQASRGKITVFLYFVLISTILIGSIMYLVEGEENGFSSIPTSIYWTIVTLTTVGYGDISPVTPLGQFIASFVMILGYGIIAVPTGIVTAEFAKSNKTKSNSKNKMFCRNCDAEDHPDKAKFCYHCGTILKEVE